MALSPEFVADHIRRWEATFAQGAYPFRARWPSHLFHHAPLENARLILESGQLLSRNQGEGRRARDVAAPAVIGIRDHAHDRVRLYFRPRTPTQYGIEGVQRANECRFEKQAPVLFMFVLDAQSVLTRQDATFSDRNMQVGAAVSQNDEASFAAIPFDRVYHFGRYDPGVDADIKERRCAEVMTNSPLQLDGVLRRICCRSEAERDTLVAAVEPTTARRWRDLITVSDDLQVFEKRFPFVQEVNVSSQGVTARFHYRDDLGSVAARVRVTRMNGEVVFDRSYEAIPAFPPQGQFWLFACDLNDDFYWVQIDLEGELAYRNFHMVGEVPF